LLAIVLDVLFALLNRALVPKGVRLATAAATGKKVSA
jgi:osmoprotectant transport system permease protein